MIAQVRRKTLSSTIQCLLAAALLFAAWPQAARAALPGETKSQKDARMKWWRDARFGMFIHWGLYSVPAGQWKGKDVRGYAEWIMNRAHIPKEEYQKLQKQFNPTKYDAKAWVSLAKRAGMKYIVITSKHHDGFCLFNSEHTDYDMAGTPYKRDLLKSLAEECHRQGLEICWYHSIMDWHHPLAKGDTFPQYVEHLKKQCKELLTNYGKIGVMWFDGEWIKDWSAEQGASLEKYLRDIQPGLIVNNRVGKRKRSPGDFGTPEQKIPATGMPGWDWETCMTINHTWGFSKHDKNWKSADDLVRKLIDVASKGGNFLLNVGPTAEGVIPQASVDRLEGMGRWLDVNGEAIYGTGPSVLKDTPWGRCTTKPGKLYLHVLKWPENGRLEVAEFKTPVKRAYMLADAKQKSLTVQQGQKGTTILVPAKASDPVATVVVVELVGTDKPAAGAVPEGFTSLFDGKTLSGWKGRDTRWSVEDGVIVGQSTVEKKLKHNEFLRTEKEYGDFELQIKFKLRNHNSGVQVRSQVHDDFVVRGYQADIAEKKYTGILYEEGGRGIMMKVDPKEVAEHLNQGQWNQYRIVCKGNNIQAFINGFQTFNYTEKKAGKPTKGIIALQLHAGPPMKVSFKDVVIKEL